MEYMLLDRLGNAINSFDDEATAHAAMRATAEDDPGCAADLLLLAYDDSGNVVGDATTLEDLPAMTTTLTGVWLGAIAMTTSLAKLDENRYLPGGSWGRRVDRAPDRAPDPVGS